MYKNKFSNSITPDLIYHLPIPPSFQNFRPDNQFNFLKPFPTFLIFLKWEFGTIKAMLTITKCVIKRSLTTSCISNEDILVNHPHSLSVLVGHAHNGKSTLNKFCNTCIRDI